MVSMAASAWSATGSKEQIIGKTSGQGGDLTVTLETGGDSAAAAPAESDDEDAITPESHWYYHLMMVIISMYLAMFLSDWSVQPVEHPHGLPTPSQPGAITEFNRSLESFWIKLLAQWVCMLMYLWTLTAPYLLRNVRDFGIEFDFD